MELAVAMLAKLLENRRVEVTFPGLDLTARDLLECASFQALCQIQDILQDDTNSDAECFQKIEDIVCALEKRGILCGPRHDFG